MHWHTQKKWLTSHSGWSWFSFLWPHTACNTSCRHGSSSVDDDCESCYCRGMWEGTECSGRSGNEIDDSVKGESLMLTIRLTIMVYQKVLEFRVSSKKSRTICRRSIKLLPHKIEDSHWMKTFFFSNLFHLSLIVYKKDSWLSWSITRAATSGNKFRIVDHVLTVCNACLFLWKFPSAESHHSSSSTPRKSCFNFLTKLVLNK